MRTYYNYDSNLRFKQINSGKQVENRLVGCSASLQPESYVIEKLECSFCNK